MNLAVKVFRGTRVYQGNGLVRFGGALLPSELLVLPWLQIADAREQVSCWYEFSFHSQSFGIWS
jgi:hypothetical protein